MTVVKVVWRAGELACSLGNWLLSQAALHSDEPLSPASQDAGEQLLSDLHREHDEPKPWCSRCGAAQKAASRAALRTLEEKEEVGRLAQELAHVKEERDELDASRGALLRSLDNILSVTGSSCATEAIGIYKRLKAERDELARTVKRMEAIDDEIERRVVLNLTELPKLYEALGLETLTLEAATTKIDWLRKTADDYC